MCFTNVSTQVLYLRIWGGGGAIGGVNGPFITAHPSVYADVKPGIEGMLTQRLCST